MTNGSSYMFKCDVSHVTIRRKYATSFKFVSCVTCHVSYPVLWRNVLLLACVAHVLRALRVGCVMCGVYHVSFVCSFVCVCLFFRSFFVVLVGSSGEAQHKRDATPLHGMATDRKLLNPWLNCSTTTISLTMPPNHATNASGFPGDVGGVGLPATASSIGPLPVAPNRNPRPSSISKANNLCTQPQATRGLSIIQKRW